MNVYYHPPNHFFGPFGERPVVTVRHWGPHQVPHEAIWQRQRCHGDLLRQSHRLNRNMRKNGVLSPVYNVLPGYNLIIYTYILDTVKKDRLMDRSIDGYTAITSQSWEMVQKCRIHRKFNAQILTSWGHGDGIIYDKALAKNYWLVVYLLLWKINKNQLGLLFPIYGKIIPMFQTTKQIRYTMVYQNNHCNGNHGWSFCGIFGVLRKHRPSPLAS